MGLFGWQEPKTCWVRSETADPCGRPAAIEIMGVLFCERCAQGHEEYAAIEELTDPETVRGSGWPREASLPESLRRLSRRGARNFAPQEARLARAKSFSGT